MRFDDALLLSACVHQVFKYILQHVSGPRPAAPCCHVCTQQSSNFLNLWPTKVFCFITSSCCLVGYNFGRDEIGKARKETTANSFSVTSPAFLPSQRCCVYGVGLGCVTPDKLFVFCGSAKESCWKRAAGCHLLIKEEHCAPFCMFLLQSLPGRKHAMISLGQLICFLYQWGNRH